MDVIYPLFIPPPELSSLPRESWTAAQAQKYLGWFQESIPSRIQALRIFLGLSDQVQPSILGLLGERMTEHLVRLQFSTLGDEPALANDGYALAADARLLLADLLQSATGVTWQIVRGPKSDVSYNLPVLSGFSNGLTLDPVGGSIGAARGVIKQICDAGEWSRIYAFWHDKAISSI